LIVLILHPDITTKGTASRLVVEDPNVSLAFEGDSAGAVSLVFQHLPFCRNASELADGTNLSLRTVKSILAIFQEDNLMLDLSDLAGSTVDGLMQKIRQASIFWNAHITSQAFPSRLFAGEATWAEVLGWGIEHYFFVRAANEYMARGASRILGTTRNLSELWKHYAEEAFHDEIFLRGLAGCGLDVQSLPRRPPLATTMALLNFLFEKSEESALSYASLFCTMQASHPHSASEVVHRYEQLRSYYPFASSLFDAFEEHDKIDAGLEHSSLTIEAIIREEWPLSDKQMLEIFRTIEQTANHFVLFFEGIPGHYKKSRLVTYRQVPNAIGAAMS
jgi:pyrroloquinoline quinone (PQQ) biosynthesis protein C